MTQAKRSTVYCGLRCIALPSPHHGKIANGLWMARLMERLHESLCLRQTTTAYVKIRQFQQDCRISCWPLFLQQFDCALRVLSDPNALCTCMRHAHTSEMRDRFARSPCIQRCVGSTDCSRGSATSAAAYRARVKGHVPPQPKEKET